MSELDIIAKYAKKMAEAFYQQRLNVANEVLADMPEGPEKDEWRKRLMASQPIHVQ